MRLRPKKKKFKVKIRNLSIRYGIYINEYMRQMENNGEIYNAIFQHGNRFYVEGIRDK